MESRLLIRLYLLGLFIFFSVSEKQYDYHQYFKREHSLMNPSHGLGGNNQFWDINGHTMMTSSHIRLTRPVRSQKGGLWNKLPVSTNWWEVEFNFKIRGETNLFGDGFAFWYVKDPLEEGPVFGSRDFFSGLGVMVDTYSNHNGAHSHDHPYVSGVVHNSTQHYDHDKDGTHNMLDGCTFKCRNSKTDTHILVRYFNDVLTVLKSDQDREYKDCFTVKGVKLPTGYHFGFSAATGDLFDEHSIQSVQVYELIALEGESVDRSLIVPSAEQQEAPRERVEDEEESSSIGRRIALLVLGIVLICGGVIVGGLIWANYKENQRKRFY